MPLECAGDQAEKEPRLVHQRSGSGAKGVRVICPHLDHIGAGTPRHDVLLNQTPSTMVPILPLYPSTRVPRHG